MNGERRGPTARRFFLRIPRIIAPGGCSSRTCAPLAACPSIESPKPLCPDDNGQGHVRVSVELCLGSDNLDGSLSHSGARIRALHFDQWTTEARSSATATAPPSNQSLPSGEARFPPGEFVKVNSLKAVTVSRSSRVALHVRGELSTRPRARQGDLINTRLVEERVFFLA